MPEQKRYDPKDREPKWQEFWERTGVYKFDSKSTKPLFTIDTPPPTVSGKMHIGHAFSYTQTDFIARYQRMCGKNVFYPFGTDDNGLATERLIEKMNNVKSQKLDRQEFIELCLKTLKKIRPDFIRDWKVTGISADWEIFYSTIDEHSRRISQESFIDLYEKGLVHRTKSPFIWCPNCQTSIAQVELEDLEKDSYLVNLRLKIIGEDKEIIIATTRPEMLPACVAVYVHPEDKRYKDIIGKNVKLPLVDREVPIIANKEVDMDYGTGAVYHCTYGDMTDADWVKEFKTEIIEIINKDGTLNKKARKYNGMKTAEARGIITRDLEDSGDIISKEKIKHVVNTHERCGTEIEILSTYQWFIKYPNKKTLLEAGSELNWFPEHMKNRYDNWVKGLKWDWAISRQRYFGVPFPVWYKDGKPILAKKEQLPVDPITDRPEGINEEVTPEKDVMDTWATSSLTPKLATELLKGTPVYEKLYPMTLRPQAHDIISFWLFNTLVKAQLHDNKNPWKDVMISGWALDPKGRKMSKSKGNVIEPQKMIEKYSADALRYWAAGSNLGEDMPFQEKELVTGAKTITKLWNASKFVLTLAGKNVTKPKKMNPIDNWILTKLTKVLKKTTESFEKYEYSVAKKEIDNFFWHTFTDNYIEMVKERIYNGEKEDASSAKFALHTSMITILKMMAPFMPHITEEIYYNSFGFKKSIHISKWPIIEYSFAKEEKEGDTAVNIIADIRKYKSEKKMAMNAPLKKVIIKNKLSKAVIETIKNTMKVKTISIDEKLKKIRITND